MSAVTAGEALSALRALVENLPQCIHGIEQDKPQCTRVATRWDADADSGDCYCDEHGPTVDDVGEPPWSAESLPYADGLRAALALLAGDTARDTASSPNPGLRYERHEEDGVLVAVTVRNGDQAAVVGISDFDERGLGVILSPAGCTVAVERLGPEDDNLGRRVLNIVAIEKADAYAFSVEPA